MKKKDKKVKHKTKEELKIFRYRQQRKEYEEQKVIREEAHKQEKLTLKSVIEDQKNQMIKLEAKNTMLEAKAAELNKIIIDGEVINE